MTLARVDEVHAAYRGCDRGTWLEVREIDQLPAHAAALPRCAHAIESMQRHARARVATCVHGMRAVELPQ